MSVHICNARCTFMCLLRGVHQRMKQFCIISFDLPPLPPYAITTTTMKQWFLCYRAVVDAALSWVKLLHVVYASMCVCSGVSLFCARLLMFRSSYFIHSMLLMKYWFNIQNSKMLIKRIVYFYSFSTIHRLYHDLIYVNW